MSDKLKPGATFPLKGGGNVRLLTALHGKAQGQWYALMVWSGPGQTIVVEIVDGVAVRVE